MQHQTRGLVGAAIVILFASAASAADPAVVCHSGKLKVTGKYAACRLNAESKGIKTASTPDFTKCESSLSDNWMKAETKAGMGICVTEMDQADIGQRTTDYADTMAILLAGNVPVECGNSVADGADQCDGADLDGQTCEGLGYAPGGTLVCTAGCAFDTAGCVSEHIPASGQTTSYGVGSDGDTQAGATLAYVDNGDGTISDTNTGLMWEKKIGGLGSVNCTDETATCANPHHASNRYAWSDTVPNHDGRVVTIFLEQLNNRCNNDTTVSCAVDADCAVPGGACGFAGHRDWRLPNYKELVDLADYERFDPAIDPAFDGANCGALCTDITDPACSCTQSSDYWSSTTYQLNPSFAWLVYFADGFTFTAFKTDDLFVRAVRSGS